MRLLLGTDVFVSYAHRDERYARSLARGLQDAGFTCVLDQHVGVPGQRLPGEVLTELKRASALIVVASEAACYSRAVQQEVRIFAPTGRPLLVLSFVPRLAQTPLGALLPGLVPHAEPEAALAGPASKGALERAIDQLDFTRQTRRIRRSVSAAAATLAVLLVAIGGALLGLGRARGELDGIEERLGNARLVLAAQSATDPLRQSLLLAEADPTLPPPGGRQLAADLAWQDVPFAVLDVEGVQAAHLSDDGTRILTVAADLRLFDAETYAELWRSTPELGTPQEAALLAQGARVLVRTVDELVLLDPAGGQPAWRCRQEPWSEGGAWNAIYRLAPGGERLLVWGERLRGLTSIAVSPSGTLELSRWDTGAEIVDATFLEYSAEVVALIHEPNQAGGLRVWTPDGKRAGLPGPSWDSRLSPGGHFAISSDDRGDLLVPTEATSSGSPRHTGSPTRARVFTDHLVEEVSLDGDVALLKGTQSGSWELCDLTGDAEPVPLPQAPWSEGEGVHFVDEDRRVLGIFDGLAVRVWNVDPESPDAPESAYSQAPIVDARWVDRKLVLGDKEGTVRIRSASDNPDRLIRRTELRRPQDRIEAGTAARLADISADRSTVLTIHEERGYVAVWRPGAGWQPRSFVPDPEARGRWELVDAAGVLRAFHPRSGLLRSIPGDPDWSGQVAEPFEVRDACVSPDGGRLLGVANPRDDDSGLRGRAVYAWELERGGMLGRIDVARGRYISLAAFAGDGRSVLLVEGPAGWYEDDARAIVVVDPDDPSERRRHALPDGSIWRFAAGRGTFLVNVLRDDGLRLLDPLAERPWSRVEPPDGGRLSYPALSEDGRTLGALCGDRELLVWDVDRPEAPRQRIELPLDERRKGAGLRLNATGTHAVVTPDNGRDLVIPLAAPSQVRRAGDADVSPDGRWMLSNELGGRVIVTDLAGELAPLALRTDTVHDFRFGPSGRLLVGERGPGSNLVMRFRWPDLLALLRDRTTVQLTPEERELYLGPAGEAR